MEFIWIIILVIGILVSIEYTANRRHCLGSKYGTANSAKIVEAQPFQRKMIPNSITCRQGAEEYKARFEDGVVYRLTDYGREYIIGYYACENGNWKVRCVSDKGEIATINSDNVSALISFNRLGDLARHRKMLEELGKTNPWLTEEEQNRQHNNAARNTKLTWMCAEAFVGFIQDTTTYDTIANFSGSDIVGASAAFVCLQYEVIMDGKYHSFFKAIN